MAVSRAVTKSVGVSTSGRGAPGGGVMPARSFRVIFSTVSACCSDCDLAGVFVSAVRPAPRASAPTTARLNFHIPDSPSRTVHGPVHATPSCRYSKLYGRCARGDAAHLHFMVTGCQCLYQEPVAL